MTNKLTKSIDFCIKFVNNRPKNAIISNSGKSNLNFVICACFQPGVSIASSDKSVRRHLTIQLWCAGGTVAERMIIRVWWQRCNRRWRLRRNLRTTVGRSNCMRAKPTTAATADKNFCKTARIAMIRVIRMLRLRFFHNFRIICMCQMRCRGWALTYTKCRIP